MNQAFVTRPVLHYLRKCNVNPAMPSRGDPTVDGPAMTHFVHSGPDLIRYAWWSPKSPAWETSSLPFALTSNEYWRIRIKRWRFEYCGHILSLIYKSWLTNEFYLANCKVKPKYIIIGVYLSQRLRKIPKDFFLWRLEVYAQNQNGVSSMCGHIKFDIRILNKLNKFISSRSFLMESQSVLFAGENLSQIYMRLSKITTNFIGFISASPIPTH